MKQIIRASFLLVLLLAFVHPAFAAGSANTGHLIIKRSPTMGRNLSVTIRIDGKLGGFSAGTARLRRILRRAAIR